MKRTFSKLFAAGLITAVAGFSSGPLGNAELAAEPFNQAIQPCSDPDDLAILCPNGEVTDVIHVTSDNNVAWTTVQPALINFPAYLSATTPGDKVLHYVKVYQGKNWIDQHMIHNPNVDGQDSYTFNGLLWGGTHNLSGSEKTQLAATCNKKLNGVAANQPQHQFTTEIPLTRLVRHRTTGDNISYSDSIPVTDTWSVTVICDSFTRQLPATDVSTDLPDPTIVNVGLGLSGNGPIAFGTLEYTGSCPMGFTLNMLWTTNIPTGLKSYVKHRNLSGQTDWTSQTFDVNTNQSAQGGLWKKEMNDLMNIPFAASVPVNGGGGIIGGNNPGGLGFNPGGGGGGGFNPAGDLGDANPGKKQYIGEFQIVAYLNKKTVPVLLPGGGMSNTTIYEGQKVSAWRKYIVNCEPKRNVSIPDGPGGVSIPDDNPANPDDQPNFPVAQYDGELDLADSALVPANQCPRQGQAVFKINSNQSSAVDYKLDCTGGRSWQGTVQMFANGVNKYQGVAAKTFDITHTENVACALKRVSGGNSHLLAIAAKQYNCIKGNVDTPTGGLAPTTRPNTDHSNVPGAVVTGHTVRPVVDQVKPNPRKPLHTGVVTTGKVDQTAADIVRKRADDARKKAEAEKRRKAAAEAAKRRKAAAEAAKRRKAAEAAAKRRKAAAEAAKRRKAAAEAAAKRRKLMEARRRAADAKKKRRVAPVVTTSAIRNQRLRRR